jgi:Flp pilus assembly pilin Flp
MTFTRFFHTAPTAISKEIPTMKGYRRAVAVCMAGLLGAIPPATGQTSSPPLALEISINIGPLATRVHITKPVAQSVTTPAGGSAVVFRSTLHVHAEDKTQTPTFNADLVSTAEAADPDTLVGGFLPAAIRVEQDILAGMTFQQAVADAQAKTGVTVTFFQDPTAVEYAVMLALIIVVCITAITKANVTPTLNGQACTIQSNLVAGLSAIGIAVPAASSCATGASTP